MTRKEYKEMSKWFRTLERLGGVDGAATWFKFFHPKVYYIFRKLNPALPE